MFWRVAVFAFVAPITWAAPTIQSQIPAVAPTLFLHGAGGTADEFDDMQGFMRARFGDDILTHSLPVFEKLSSITTPCLKQRDSIIKYLLAHRESLKLQNGFNFVAHSQGGLLARSVIQALPETLHVLSFISLASPQHGQWGTCQLIAKRSLGGLLNNAAFASFSKNQGYLALYNPFGQHISIGNYWRDPRHMRQFLRQSDFLPFLNNLQPHEDSERFKSNFLRLKKAVFVGSEADDCTNPPLSAVFDYVDEYSQYVPMNTSEVYLRDTFGLRSMEERGDLVIARVGDVEHEAWLHTQGLFDRYIAPHLS